MKTSWMRIPKSSASAILGSGGQKISRIRAKSGANIWLGDVADCNAEIGIRIIGTVKEREKACFLLRQSIREQYRVMVTGLPLTASWQDLKDHMRKAGDIGYSEVVKNGKGVVTFLRREGMKCALKKLDNSRFESRKVSEAISSIVRNITFIIEISGRDLVHQSEGG